MSDPSAQLPDRIYHVTFASAWKDAQSGSEYTLSSRGAHLDDVGYIHASFDPGRLGCPVRIESLDGGAEQFPHIYGPLPTAAVVDVLSARLDGTRLVVEGLDS